MCGKQMPPPNCRLLPLVPSNSFLSLLMSFFAMRHLELPHLVCVLSGVGWRGHSQPWLLTSLLTSPECFARMEAVVNLYQAMLKHAGKMLCSCLSSLLP